MLRSSSTKEPASHRRTRPHTPLATSCAVHGGRLKRRTYLQGLGLDLVGHYVDDLDLISHALVLGSRATTSSSSWARLRSS